MRFILLKSEDFLMFNKDIDLVEFEFYIRHKEAFRRMYDTQGKEFWIRFVLSFRSAQNDDVLRYFRGRIRDLANHLDSFFIKIHEEFTEGPFPKAKQFFHNILTIVLDQNAASAFSLASIVKNPFCRKETKDIYHQYFGNQSETSSFAKVIVFFPLFRRFAGALCICLRRWLDAKEMDNDLIDNSYWIAPVASPIMELEKKSVNHDKPDDIYLEDLLKLELMVKTSTRPYCPCSCHTTPRCPCCHGRMERVEMNHTCSETAHNCAEGSHSCAQTSHSCSETNALLEKLKLGNTSKVRKQGTRRIKTKSQGKKSRRSEKIDSSETINCSLSLGISVSNKESCENHVSNCDHSGGTGGDQLSKSASEDSAIKLEDKKVSDDTWHNTDYNIQITVDSFSAKSEKQVFEDLATAKKCLIDSQKNGVKCDVTLSVDGVPVKRFVVEQGTSLKDVFSTSTSTQEDPSKTNVLITQKQTSKDAIKLKRKMKRARRKELAQAMRKASKNVPDVGSGSTNDSEACTESKTVEGSDSNWLDQKYIYVPALKSKVRKMINKSRGCKCFGGLSHIITNTLLKSEITKTPKGDTAVSSTKPKVKEIEKEVSIVDQEHLERQMLGMKLSPLETSADGKPEVVRSSQKKRRICVCCGLEEPAPKTFKKCKRCKEEGFKDPSFYCGRDCQIKDWNVRHREDHERLCSKAN